MISLVPGYTDAQVCFLPQRSPAIAPSASFSLLIYAHYGSKTMTMPRHRTAKSTQPSAQQVGKKGKAAKQGQMHWLLRNWIILEQQRSHLATSGFVLPIVALLLLVVALVAGAIAYRSMNRSVRIVNERQTQIIYNAATPAIDRAKSKLEYLFTREQLPLEPKDSELIGKMSGTDGAKYNLPDEQRVDLNPDLEVGDDLAWAFRADTNGDGTPDAITVYGVFMRVSNGTGSSEVSFRGTTANPNPTDADKAKNLVVQNGPLIVDTTTNPNCQVGTTTTTGEAAWLQTNSSAVAKKAFQVFAVTIPDQGTADQRAVAALKYQQDRSLNLPNKWAAWFRNDLEIFPGPNFNWNGAIHTEGSLFVTSGNGFRSYLISDPTSCYFNPRVSSEISLKAEAVVGSIRDNNFNAGSGVYIDVWPASPASFLNLALTNANDSINPGPGINPINISLNPLTILTKEISEPRTAGAWVRDPNWDNAGNTLNRRIDLDPQGKCPPYVDDTYRADNRYGPKPGYGRPAGTPCVTPIREAIGGAIPSTATNLVADDPADPTLPEEVGLDGYWERRARREGTRLIVGQRLELGNAFGWGAGDKICNGNNYLCGNTVGGWQGSNDPLYPPVTINANGARNNEARQRRTLRDNLAAVQSTAIYHYTQGSGRFPVACLATTAHPGTGTTLTNSTTFNNISFVPVGSSTAQTYLNTDFLTGRGTNGWEFPAPAADEGAFASALGANQPLRVALTNLANFAGEINGAFPPLQESAGATNPLVHPYPNLTMWGNYSSLRRILGNDPSASLDYTNLSLADKTTLQTAACTMGMLANQINNLQRYDYTNATNQATLSSTTSNTDLEDGIRLLSDLNFTAFGTINNTAFSSPASPGSGLLNGEVRFFDREDSNFNLTNSVATAFGAGTPETGEDSNNNGVADVSEDYDYDGRLDTTAFGEFDRNGNGCFDREDDFNNNGVWNNGGSGSISQQCRDPITGALIGSSYSVTQGAQITTEDRNGNGRLDSIAIVRVYGSGGTILSTMQVDKLLGNEDTNGNGILNTGEDIDSDGALGPSTANGTLDNTAVNRNPRLEAYVLGLQNLNAAMNPGTLANLARFLQQKQQVARDRQYGFAQTPIIGGTTRYNVSYVDGFRHGGVVYDTNNTAGTIQTTVGYNQLTVGCDFNATTGNNYFGFGAPTDADSERRFILLATTLCPAPQTATASQMLPTPVAGATGTMATVQPRFPALYYLFPRADHAHDGIAADTTRTVRQPASTTAPTAYYVPDYHRETYIADTNIFNRTTSSGINWKDTNDLYQVVVDTDGDTVEDGPAHAPTENGAGAIALQPRARASWLLPNTTTTTDRANIINDNGTNVGIAFLDKGIMNGREMMNVRVLDLDLDLLRRNTIGGDFWISTSNAPTDSPRRLGGIVFAFREDAVREDAVARPASSTWSTYQTWYNSKPDGAYVGADAANIMNANGANRTDPPVCVVSATSTDCDGGAQGGRGISPKIVDYYPDPDRRPNGFRLRNGESVRRLPSPTSVDANKTGLTLISDNPVYIQGDFNLHSTNETPGNLLEEFSDQVLDGVYTQFYNRNTLDTRFSRPTTDTWRTVEIVSDAITILSENFNDGGVEDYLTDVSGTSYDNQNKPTTNIGAANRWRREDPADGVFGWNAGVAIGGGSPVLFNAFGEPVHTGGPYNGAYQDFSAGGKAPGAQASRVNAVIASAIVPSRVNQAYGGLHNYPRFLQSWGGNNLVIYGSMIQLNFSTSATAPFDQDAWEPPQAPIAAEEIPYYGPPPRRWGYDVGLQYTDAGPLARRLFDIGKARDEFYQQPALDTPYICRLRRATKPTAFGSGQIDLFATSTNCPI